MEKAMSAFLVPALPQAQQDSTRRYTAHEWEQQKVVVKQLYIEGDRKLPEVLNSLAEAGFFVTAKQLKTRLAKWGFEKNVKEDSMVAIARARLNRKVYENKNSAFRVNKRPVDERKIDRFLKRKRISEEELLLMDTPIDAPSPVFSVYTPRPPTPGGESATSPIAAHTTVSLAPSLNLDNSHHQGPVDGSNLDDFRLEGSWTPYPRPTRFRGVSGPPSEKISPVTQKESDIHSNLSHQAMIHYSGVHLLPSHPVPIETRPRHDHGQTVANHYHSKASIPSQTTNHQLPAHVKPLPERVTPTDKEYLFSKGALSMPSDLVLRHLVESYAEYVYPSMPAIDLPTLLHVINDRTGESGQTSLLLLQAIMFAGSTFVDLEHLKSMGFLNRKAARKAFFLRAKVLYDLDCEIDRKMQIQALLLMTYWYETPDDQKDTWHWMGVAVSLAHTIGLHKWMDDTRMSAHEKRLWKRMWWSCYTRDRIIALGMRRPARLTEHDVPMLKTEDFDIEHLIQCNTIFSISCPVVVDREAQTTMALMFVARAELCLHISRVLTLQYPAALESPSVRRKDTPLAATSGQESPKDLIVQVCDGYLEDWKDELLPSCDDFENLALSNRVPSVLVHILLLRMLYFTVQSALHRPQILPSTTSQSPSISTLISGSRRRVREAAKEITKASKVLYDRDLVRYLPTEAITVLLPAIIIHLLDMKSIDHELGKTAVADYLQCMLVLDDLKEMYASAEFAVQFLEAAIRKADLESIIGDARRNIKQWREVGPRIWTRTYPEPFKATSNNGTAVFGEQDANAPAQEPHVLPVSKLQQSGPVATLSDVTSPPLDQRALSPSDIAAGQETNTPQVSSRDGSQHSTELFYPSDHPSPLGLEVGGISMASSPPQDTDSALLDFDFGACVNNWWEAWEPYVYGTVDTTM